MKRTEKLVTEIQDGCESGDCGANDGPELGSLKFRVSLGSAGYRQSGGFIWFNLDAMPAAMTSEIFNLSVPPMVSVTSNAAALALVDNQSVNGRRIALSATANGVVLNLSRYDSSLESSTEGSWTITKTGDAMTFISRDQADNILRSLTYTFGTDINLGWYGYFNSAWTETDNLTGAVRSLGRREAAGVDREMQYLDTRDAAGHIHSGTLREYEFVGVGTAAVKRVVLSSVFGAYDDWWDQNTEYYYHEDNLNPRVNGKLKLQCDSGGSWEYHLWDSSGRETLRVVSQEGCGTPSYLWHDADNFDFNPSAVYAGLRARITQYDYAAQAGDSGDWRDAAKPRTVTEYRVGNGSPVLTARTWHTYQRSTTNILGETYSIITYTAIRAASQNSVITDAANPTSIETAFLDDYSGGIHLDGRPLYRRNEDGTTATWEYDIDGTLVVRAYTGTESAPKGIADRSTCEIEEIDLYYGHTLSRATMLYRGAREDVPLDYELNDYDSKGRLISTVYSDGTAVSNIYDCCRLLMIIARDGGVTEYSNPPGFPLISETGDISVGLLPGADGAYPVSGAVVDLLGRVTNSYTRVDGAARLTVTEYPEYSSHLSVTTDHLGIVTTNRTTINRFQTPYVIIEETTRAGVTTTTERLANGEPVTTVEWTDPVSDVNLKRMTKTESGIQPNDWQKTTASVKYDDGEWLVQSETVKDMLGRTITSSRAGTGGAMLTTSNVYDSSGMLVRSVNHDGSSVVYEYNELNERTAAVSVGAGQTLDFDPLNFTLSGVIALDKYLIDQATEVIENSEGIWWRNSSTVFYKPGEEALTTSVQRVQLTGLTLGCNSKTVTEDADGNTTVTTESLNPSTASRTVTTVNATLGLTNVSYSVAGYETCSTNSLGGVTEHEYDGFARRVETANYADGRGLESVTTYHDDGSVATVGEVTASGTNTTSYTTRQSVAGILGAYKITVTDPAGSQTVNYYSGDGQLYRSEGATYPNATVRDAAGLMSELHTWRDENGDPDITRWYYDLFTGAVTNKLYADGNGTFYSYLSDGRVLSRLWARNITTTYGYTDTATGSIRTTEYSDSTPDLTNTYNLVGQLIEVQDGTGTTTFGYDSRGRQVAETNALAVITRSYDTLGRYIRFTLTPLSIINSPLSINYGYDIYNRLDTITAIVGSETNTFTYSYIPGTQLVSGYTATSSISTHQLSALRFYETDRDLISSITNTFVTSVPFVVSSFDYSNDSTGKRTERIDGYNGSTSTNTFGYNVRSEVTNAVMNSSEQSIVYDDIGNRDQCIIDNGQLMITNSYTANNLNQYISVDSVSSVVSPTHDLDGNLTYDGSAWHHTYDAENRLIGSSPNTVTNGSVMLEYAYNYKNLRVEKIRKQLSGRDPGYPMDPLADTGIWDAIETRQYVWDGFNITAEIIIDHVTPATNISFYTWGIDLSGSLQGAGGVGGLLCDTKVTASSTNTYYACADANGNITEYVDENGSLAAHGEHSSFGETKLDGSMKDDFTHWFSSKPLDKTTGLISYELRYFKPDFTWLSRDPIGIKGGLNDYGFVNNDAVNRWDKLGLSWTEVLTWFGGWVSGSGKSFRALGPTSNAANDMKNTHYVNKARKLFKEKNKDVKCCKDLKDYINYKADFRLPGLFASGANSTRQFIGSYRIDIYLFGCVNHKCKIDFELHNTTSATSFFYGLFPSWEREEFRMMGNVRQTIWWTEVYDAECP